MTTKIKAFLELDNQRPKLVEQRDGILRVGNAIFKVRNKRDYRVIVGRSGKRFKVEDI